MVNASFFRLTHANPNPALITDAEWWLWLKLHELEPTSQLGGIYANKSGFHNQGSALEDHGEGNSQTDYSIRHGINRTGTWWKTKASALDWTFPEAHNGNYARIDKYTSRLLASALDANDARLDLILFEFLGQADNDTVAEGYNEYQEYFRTPDSSHLWHIHFSFLRSKCGDFMSMYALLTVIWGWTVAQWRESLVAGILTDADKPIITNGVWSPDGDYSEGTYSRGGMLYDIWKRTATLANTQLPAVLKELAEEETRTVGLVAAVDALAAVLKTGGGDVDVAAIAAHIDAKTAETNSAITAMEQLHQAELDQIQTENAAMRVLIENIPKDVLDATKARLEG